MLKVIRLIGITSLTVLGLFTATVYTSCNKDKYTYTDECANVVCQNGGNCLSGKCTCRAGFEGEHCETAWLSRYLGQWDFKQKIGTSTNQNNWGKEKSYRATVKSKDNGVSTFYIDGFMGDSNLNDVKCKIGVQADGTLNFVATQFIFEPNQAIAGSDIMVVSGEGTVNSLGTVLSGQFEIRYPDTDKYITETITFGANYVD